jgi:hypothetical protein
MYKIYDLEELKDVTNEKEWLVKPDGTIGNSRYKVLRSIYINDTNNLGIYEGDEISFRYGFTNPVNGIGQIRIDGDGLAYIEWDGEQILLTHSKLHLSTIEINGSFYDNTLKKYK